MVGWYGRVIALVPLNRRAIQNFHLGQTPRLGGIGVIFATLIASTLFFPSHFWAGYILIFFCCLPALCLGLLEDIGIRVAPVLRLCACFICAAVYLFITGDALPRVGIEAFDAALRNVTFSLLISAICVTVAVQAMNLIDGLNGLCSGIGFMICMCMALIANKAGNDMLFYITTTSSVAILGFFVVNYPSGGIFLGDSGAYWIGFSLSLLGIYFMRQIPSLESPALLLIFFWPAFDVCLAVARRLLLRRRLFSPDRIHPHHIAVRVLEARLVGPQRLRIANSLAACIILALAVPPMTLGVVFWNNQVAAWSALLVCLFGYTTLYIVAVRATRRDLARRGGRGATRLADPQVIASTMGTLSGMGAETIAGDSDRPEAVTAAGHKATTSAGNAELNLGQQLQAVRRPLLHQNKPIRP